MNFRKFNKLNNIINNTLWDLPTSSSLTYMWNFGSMLGLCLITQLVSGILLTLHYTSFSEESFSSVVMIMENVWYGWLIRLFHVNGASLFFIFIYMHLFRGIFYFSSKNTMTWMTGVLIMLLLMIISFLGYVLPWGQMSYWAVAVITNLFSIIPMVGEMLVNWIWGGFSVGKPTLMRFYSFHFLFPMLLVVMVTFHLILLHEKGSSNPLGLESNMDKVPFNPFFVSKDILFILFFFFMMLLIGSIFPMMFMDPINNIPANPMQTPTHIQPEWYFLPYYAILRAMPNKIVGVLALIFSVTIYFTMSFSSMKYSSKFTFYRNFIFWTFLSSFFILTKLGSMPAEEPFILMSMMWSSIYFTTILLMNS